MARSNFVALDGAGDPFTKGGVDLGGAKGDVALLVNADGSDYDLKSNLGLAGDTASTNPATAATLIAVTKGLAALLAQLHADFTGPTPAGANAIGSVTVTGTTAVNIVGGQLGETLWTDDTGSYFVRLDSGGTITFYPPAGGAAVTPGAGLRPSGDAATVDKTSYVAAATATGYAAGDLIDHLVAVDRKTGAIVTNQWLNSTQGTVLGAAPPAANITAISAATQSVAVVSSALPTGAMLDATGQSIATTLATPATALPPEPLLYVNTGLTGVRINSNTAATISLLAGITGQTIRVHRIRFKIASNAATGATIDICSNATILERFELGIGEGIALDFSQHPHYKTVDGDPLNMVISAAVSVQGRFSYAQTA